MSRFRTSVTRLSALARVNAVVPRRTACAVDASARVVVPAAPCGAVRTIATTAPRLGEGESDSELIASLQQEIAYEKDSVEASSGDGANLEWLRQFKSDSPWHIEDKSGSDEIALTRDFGNEHIRVLFSIGEIDTSEGTNDIEQEDADQVSADDEFEGGFPVRCAITISKPDQGCLSIDAQAQDGQFMVENVTFYKDNALATALTADADWARRGLYIGPQFETLDENVQANFESYLAERGVATNLALFIPNYAEYKEQREYCSWLMGVKSFVEA
ncbi:Mitochondrial acidic protein mam33 [Malassezia sp. CBS 17886]|nr:Mitochondrial acidic protein mam33 [Malassezia sp. CBS 17886]